MLKQIKKILKIILGITLIIVLLIGYFIVQGILKENEQKSLESMVEMTINYSVNACSENFPLQIKIVNNSNKTVNNIDFDIGVYREQHSTDISDYLDYNSDRIISSKQSHTSCWRYELKSQYEKYNDPNNLIFKIKYKFVDFED